MKRVALEVSLLVTAFCLIAFVIQHSGEGWMVDWLLNALGGS